jgi:hypothetical protein
MLRKISILINIVLIMLFSCSSNGTTTKVTLLIQGAPDVSSLDFLNVPDVDKLAKRSTAVPADVMLIEVAEYTNAAESSENRLFRQTIDLSTLAAAGEVTIDVLPGANVIFVVEAWNTFGSVNFKGQSGAMDISAGSHVDIPIDMNVVAVAPPDTTAALNLITLKQDPAYPDDPNKVIHEPFVKPSFLTGNYQINVYTSIIKDDSGIIKPGGEIVQPAGTVYPNVKLMSKIYQFIVIKLATTEAGAPVSYLGASVVYGLPAVTVTAPIPVRMQSLAKAGITLDDGAGNTPSGTKIIYATVGGTDVEIYNSSTSGWDIPATVMGIPSSRSWYNESATAVLRTIKVKVNGSDWGSVCSDLGWKTNDIFVYQNSFSPCP